MIPLLRLTARSCKRELIASTVALVKRLIGEKAENQTNRDVENGAAKHGLILPAGISED